MKTPSSISAFALLIQLYFCIFVFAQDQTAPSKINSLKNPREKVLALNKYCSKELDRGNVLVYPELKEAMELAKKINLRPELGDANNNLGVYHLLRNDFQQALSALFEALKIFEILNDEPKVADVENQIGRVYIELGDYTKARNYILKSLHYNSGNKQLKQSGSNFLNLGIIEERTNHFDSAIYYFDKAIEIYHFIRDEGNLARAHNNKGILYSYIGDAENELENYNIALSIFSKLFDQVNVAKTINNIAIVYLSKGNPDKAISLAQKSDSIGRSLADISISKEALLALSIGFKEKGNLTRAYQCLQQYIILKDSLFNIERNKDLEELSTQYETEKKEHKIKLLNNENIFKENQIVQHNIQRNFFIAGAVITLIFFLILFNAYRKIKSINSLLETKNNEITQQHENLKKANILISDQKHLLQEKNKDITDSINYAKRIQTAILPERLRIYKSIENCFILFKPKDIVSGDFFFFKEPEAENEPIILAAADCTGHGVPGALMSMIGSEKLNDASEFSKDPGVILSILNKGIKHSLNQTGEDSTRDGMDIALLSLKFKVAGEKLERGNSKFKVPGLKLDNEDKNSSKCIIEYAGANRPLWIIRNGAKVLEEIKATKSAIGGFTGVDQNFETHTLSLESGDTIYMSSDGFADQFNSLNKKLMVKRFKETLISIQSQSMQEQEIFLSNFLEEWKGAQDQTDDILVIGIRVG